MPYSLAHRGGQWCVVKTATGEPVPGGCHSSKEAAVQHLVAMKLNVKA